MRKLLSSFGQFCLGRSLGETGELLGGEQMSFEVTGQRLSLSRALGREALGKTVVAEMTSARDLAQNAREARRLGHPIPGAEVVYVFGAVFRVGPSQVLLIAADQQGEPSRDEFDRLLLALRRRAIDATP